MFLVDPAPLTRQDLANIVTSRAMQVLLISVISMLTAQILKVIFYSIKDKRPRFELFISTGGFPSSHTAFCIALDISLGMIQWYTENKLDWSFTVAVVFSAIVIHDATGVRLEASKHAKILNRIAENLTEEEFCLREQYQASLNTFKRILKENYNIYKILSEQLKTFSFINNEK